MRVRLPGRRDRVDPHQRADPVRARPRGVNFLRLIDWDFGAARPTPGWFPRRERFDLRTIVVGSVDHGRGRRCSSPCRSGSARRSTSPSTRPRRVRKVVKPIIEVLAGIPSVVVGFFVAQLHRPRVVNQLLRPAAGRQDACSSPGSASASSSSRSWRRSPRTRCARCPTRCAKRATAAAPARSPPSSGSCSRRRCPASSPRSIIAVSRAIGETMVAAMAGGYDGAGPYNGCNPLNGGLTMTGGDDERRRRHRQRGRAGRRSRCCSSSVCCCS